MIPGLLHLALDLALLGFIAERWTRSTSVVSPTERWAEGLLLGLTLIVVGGLVLGYAGALNTWALTGFFGLFAIAVGLRPGQLPAAPPITRKTPSPEATPPAFRVALGLGACLLVIFLIVASCSTPLVYDALTYRMPRIGHWLQEQSLHPFATNDSRQNFMALAPDLTMLWLTGHFPDGFRLTAVAQWLGGTLMLLHVWQLGALLGLTRPARITALFLAGGLGNVVPQFLSDQTDLFTAGLVTAALARWLAACRNRRFDPWAGVALGLAFASKGTVFYAAPAIALIAVGAAWIWHMPVKLLGRHAAAGTIALIAFAGPRMWENHRVYGNPWAPPDMIEHLHAGDAGELPRKLAANLVSCATQTLEPHANSPWLAPLLQPAGRWLIAHQPADREFVYEGAARSSKLTQVFDRRTADADVVAIGVAPLLLALLGAGLALAHWRQGDAGTRGIALLGVASGVFVVFYNVMQHWHPYAFRYFVLLAPMLGLCGAWALDRLAQGSNWLLLICIALQLATAANLFCNTYQVGWRNLSARDRVRDYAVVQAQRRLLGRLPPAATACVVLPYNFPLAGCYRLPNGPRIRQTPLAVLRAQPTAAAFLDSASAEAMLCPLPWFEGRAGPSTVTTFVLPGQADSPFNLACYRRPQAAGGRPAR
ncbi:MAG: hypothetical protein HZA31_10890 [Opitutae bacterium]|nr:hypothetical protein [Opitutae bacterium]